mmetsp:Transcript_19558/g.22667  ORF Transcript_19558/g.22667 Transcript_19558/m.22667 type:complete len:109 (+) Transcript_19558:479-805(+)
MASWSKFHERHGSITAKRPNYVYGSYISDPRQYERSSEKGSMLTKVVSCLGCLLGAKGPSRRDTRNQNGSPKYTYNYSSSGQQYNDHEPFVSGRRSRNRTQGNINYLQ